MNAIVNCSRRSFLKSSALAGGGLILGVHLPGLRNSVRASDQPASTVALNAFVRIAPDEKAQELDVTLMIHPSITKDPRVVGVPSTKGTLTA